jgi:hypothetical protein
MLSQPISVAEPRRSAIIMFRRLIELYGQEQSSQRGYRPAALALAFFDHELCVDAFLMSFFSFLYHTLHGETKRDIQIQHYALDMLL